jgi:hypothetical protein
MAGTPDWGALASENERFVTGAGASGERLVPPALWRASAEQVAGTAHAWAVAGTAAVRTAGAGTAMATVMAVAGPAAVTAAAGPAAGTAAASGSALPRRPRWRHRAARGAAAAGAAALAVTGTASASAAPAAAPLAWHFVKQAHQGANGGFTALAAVGRTGGWAFSGAGSAAPTAFRRSGATWSPAPFPGRRDERVLAAQATSAANVWAFTTNGTASRALRWNGSRWSVAGSFPREISGAAVVSSTDVWVFGDQFQPGGTLGTWHYDGRTWTHVPGEGGLHGGYALSATSVWAFGGTRVAHWNGRAWSSTSVAGLLPARDKNGLNSPGVTAIYAQSPASVWAVGTGAREDEGGPLVVLHFNGHAWSQVAHSDAFAGDPAFGQVAPDGRGGLWIPMPGTEGGAGHLVRYFAGHLTPAVLPVAAARIAPEAVAWIPGTFQALAGGITHAPGNFGASDVSVILQFER